MLDIEVQGVKSIKDTKLNPNFVFIVPPSMEELERRLRNRGTESEDKIAQRLELARKDMKYGEAPGNFDIVIVNDDLTVAYDTFKGYLLKMYPNQIKM